MRHLLSDEDSTLVVEWVQDIGLYEISLMKKKYPSFNDKDLGQVVCNKESLEELVKNLKEDKTSFIECSCISACSIIKFTVDTESNSTYIVRYIHGFYRDMINKHMANDVELPTINLIGFLEKCLEDSNESNS